MPFCPKCGAEANGAFCGQCGTPVAGGGSANPYQVGSNVDLSNSEYDDPSRPEIPNFGASYARFWRCLTRERCSRTEFWFAALGNYLVQILGGGVVGGVVGGLAATREFDPDFISLASIIYLCFFFLASVVPATCLTIRRLRDSNLPGWLSIFVPLICAAFIVNNWGQLSGRGPFVGLIPQLATLIAVLVYGLLPPTLGPNRYGAQPIKRIRRY